MRAMARSPTTDANIQTQAAGSRRAPDAKSRLMTAIGQMVDDGKAEWSRTATGEVELRLSSGEVFVLGEISVTRVA
ncbi:hypothetical protein EN991_12495 [Mesorhizobium sp. M7A.F.Ca.US.005.03.2.1]|uniref:hypothetical protein n=1 Tax=Mesorhizobium sp. M7A.F.Ca.US.005.03.2.1 TaxID=2496737 RepID=UPI000FCA82FA|nr:hypothetical protein [Mesorhizobium sp. M7A.F.Ca.US.005.03.2.1]RUY16119.1 hypothetical protein EN991_12495 [Mesorhizobium sp. M7A.F.Ca.US.005.03.2.1]